MDLFEQFLIKKIINISLFGFDISITNSTLSMLMMVISVFILTKMIRNDVIPSPVQVLIEIVHNFVKDIVLRNIGRNGLHLLPFFITLFLFILLSGIMGLIPGGFTVTSHIIVTFVLALIVILSTIAIGIHNHGLRFLGLFFPKSVPTPLLIVVAPIEIFTFFARSMSLSIRLFANTLAGHIMFELVMSFISIQTGYIGSIVSFIGCVLLIGYECFITVMQAYIFTTLSCSYVSDSINLH